MGLTYSILGIFQELIPLVAVDILDDDTQFVAMSSVILENLHNPSTVATMIP